MRNRLFLKLCGIVFICTVSICWGSSAEAKVNTRDCLQAVQKSIDNTDADAFERLVNLDGILAGGLESFLQEMARPGKAELLPPMVQLLLSGFHGMQGQLTRGLILKELAAFIHNGVASGAFAGKPASLGESSGIIAPLFSNASLGRKQIGFIGPETVTDNGVEASFIVHDYGNDNDYPVQALFADKDTGYCIVEIKNFPELIDQIIAEANQ